VPDALIGNLTAVFLLFFGGLFSLFFHSKDIKKIKLNMQSNFYFFTKYKLIHNLIKYLIIFIDIWTQRFYCVRKIISKDQVMNLLFSRYYSRQQSVFSNQPAKASFLS